MRSSLFARVLVTCLGIGAAPTQAQTPAPAGTLVVTIVDSTGAVLPGATVTVTGIEAANKAATIEPVKTTDQGVARTGRHSKPPGDQVPNNSTEQRADEDFRSHHARFDQP